MPHELTARERQAAGLERDALAHTDDTLGHIRAAERALLDEEREHAPHVGIVNQHKLCAYAEIIVLLGDVRGEIVARLTGTPQAAT